MHAPDAPRPGPLARLTLGLQGLLALGLLLVHVHLIWTTFVWPLIALGPGTQANPVLLSLMLLVVAAPAPALVVLLGVLRDRWIGRREPYDRRQRGVTLLFLAIGLLDGMALTILLFPEELAILPALGVLLGVLQLDHIGRRSGWARTTPDG